jgi:hypothetical protein
MGRFLGDAASDAYGISGAGDQIQSFLPRSKFQFYVELTYRNPEALTGFDTVRLTRIAGIQQPSYTPRTQVVNQYNRKRVIQTGLDYNPITLTAYDTRDALIETILKRYSEFYFKGPMSVDSNGILNYGVDNVSSSDFAAGSSQHGLRLQKYKQFFTKLEIYRISSIDDNNITTIYNPFITAI